MTEVIDLEKERLAIAARRGFRNWVKRFREDFGVQTRFCNISPFTLHVLAQGKEKDAFYIYDLIMNLHHWGSGFEFNELAPGKKMAVIDQYLFLLDQTRFECMKRLGWLESYAAEGYALVELVGQFERLGPALAAKEPVLSQKHPAYETYRKMNIFDRESFVRKLVPELLKKIEGYSTTL